MGTETTTAMDHYRATYRTKNWEYAPMNVMMDYFAALSMILVV